MNKIMFKYLILILVILCASCNKKAKLSVIQVHYDTNSNNKDYCFVYYYDHFGDTKNVFLANDKSLSLNIKTYLPMTVFFGSNEKIHQPVVLFTNKPFEVKKQGQRHLFESSKNICNESFLEKSEREFGYIHIGSSLGDDDDELYWLQPDSWFQPEYAIKGNYSYAKLKGDKWLFKEHLKYLENYRDTCHFDKKYKKIFTKNLEDYYLLKTIIKTLATKSDSLKDDDKLIKEIYSYKSRLSNEINLSKGVQLHTRRLVYYYNIFLSRESLGKADEFDIQWKNANNEFKGQTKEFLLFMLLKKYMRRGVNDFQSYLSDFHLKNKNLEYGNYIDSMYRKNNHNFDDKELDTVLKDSLNNSITLREILEKHKNKIVYLDFWASWCNPCRKEMKFYPKLKEGLSKSDVSFVFISIDEKEKAWKLAIDKTDTKNYEHYILNKNSELYNFFDLSTIPRHAIVNRDGKLINFNAPRPHQVNMLKNIINNLHTK